MAKTKKRASSEDRKQTPEPISTEARIQQMKDRRAAADKIGRTRRG